MIALKLMPVLQSYWTLKDADIVSSIFWWEFLEGFSHAVLFFFFFFNEAMKRSIRGGKT